MVSLKVNFKKKDLWLLSAIIVFLVGVGYVIAIGSGNYMVQGHDASELTGVCKTDGTGCPTSVGGSLAFGAWVDISSTPIDGSSQTPFSSDGFIVTYGNSYNSIIIDTPDGTTRCKLELGHGNDRTGNMCPIKKGDTWSIWSNVAGGLTIYWIPIVSGSSGSFGSWTTTDSLGNILVADSVYKADCDGFISFSADSAGTGTFIYTDSSNPPTTAVAGSDAINSDEAGNAPVKEGEYVRISTSAASFTGSIRWRPIGSCSLIKQ